jgi:hypothetical protein
MKVNVEVTDTFSGEANYCWVKRHSIECMDTASNYSIVRRVKRLIGWSGKRCLTVDYNYTIELRPYGECQVAFISFEQGAS